MKRHFLISVGGLVLVALASTPALAQSRKATLDGYQEVGTTGPISTTGGGKCTASVSKDQLSIKLTLDYSDLEAEVQQAHIHFGAPGVNGGIMVFFCTNLLNGPVGTPECPAPPASIERTVGAADIVGPTAQGIEPGSLSEVIAALANRIAYCNVHSARWPGGEIRGNMH